MKPLDRISVIQQSLRVFVCGIIGLCPIIGIFPAMWALVGAVRIHRGYHDFNPAAPYAKWGVTFALLGIFVSFLATVAFGFSLVSQNRY